MDITEIIMDSLNYPLNNIKALVTYLVLGIIAGVGLGITVIATAFTGADTGVGIIAAIIGFIIFIAVLLLIEGYMLDVIKLGINRSQDAPEIDIVRQIKNGIKLLITTIVYMIIPFILTVLLGLIFQHWISYLIGFILMIIFALALYMGECRLAQTEELNSALDIRGALDDLMAIGHLKVLLTIIVVFVLSFVIELIIGGIFQLIGVEILTSIVSSVVSVYLAFFSSRATGLLYSDR